MPMSSQEHWDEYAKSGEITGFMITDALTWKYVDTKTRDRRYPASWTKGLQEVCDTLVLVEDWISDFSEKYLATFSGFEEGMMVTVGDIEARTMKTCGRTVLTLTDKVTNASITLKGEDPADKVFFHVFCGTRAEMKKILTTTVLPPSCKWEKRNLRLGF